MFLSEEVLLSFLMEVVVVVDGVVVVDDVDDVDVKGLVVLLVVVV